MYLTSYTAPSDKVRVTVVSSDAPLRASDERVRLIVYNHEKDPVEVGFSIDVKSKKPVGSLMLAGGQSMELGGPVWLGPVYVTSRSITVTEFLRRDVA